MGEEGMERRFLVNAEVRLVEPEGEPAHVVGYAAVFDSPISESFPWVEVVRPGAFARALAERQDARSLFNHDANYVLGRVSAGTVTFVEDERGLRFDAVPPDTQWARDLLVSIRRGDVTGASFGFRAVGEKWVTMPDKSQKRELLDVDLYDGGPVTFPAYNETSVSVRQKAADLRAQAEAEAVSDRREDPTRARGDLVRRLKARKLVAPEEV